MVSQLDELLVALLLMFTSAASYDANAPELVLAQFLQSGFITSGSSLF